MNIYDISEKAGVSIATVSRVLNNSPHVSEATRKKVLRVIQKSNYVPNAFARGLGLGSMKTIGLLCPDASDPYLAAALSRLEAAFRGHQYDCLLVCTGTALEDRAAGIRQLASRHVDGVVLMGSFFVEGTEGGNSYLRQATDVPMVLLGGTCNVPGVWCVCCDDQQITLETVQELAAAGRRRILYLYHNRNHAGRKKLTGYKAGLASCGIEVDEELIRYAGQEKSSVQHVRDQLLALYRKGLTFDAVMTSEDVLAVGALKFARAAELRVPEDVAVVGYNNSDLCLCCEPELSSVDNRLDDVCDAVVRTMLGVLSGQEMPHQQTLSGRVVGRASTPRSMVHL